MRKQVAAMALLLGLGFGALIAVPASPVSDPARIAQLITQLGSANFRERDAATKELDAIGEPALEALRVASKNTDMEIADRASSLVAKIVQRNENAKLLAPTYVELSFKNTPVEEAVAELARKSGYLIVIGGDKSKLANRLVTFETGKVPFWKAFDMLCEKAELVESEVVQTGNNVQPTTAVPIRNNAPPPIQVQPVPVPANPINKPRALPVEKPQPQQPKAPEGFSADAPPPVQKEAPEVPAQPVQIQVQLQLQPAPAPAPVQNQAIPRAVARMLPAPGNNQKIVLVDGKPSTSPAHVEGAFRIRAIDSADVKATYGPAPQGEIGLFLEVKSEPKIQVQQILGVKIDKAVDDLDQNLDQSMVASNADLQIDGAPQLAQIKQLQKQAIMAQAVTITSSGTVSNRNIVPARLKKGEKEAKSIKELRGTVSLKIRTPAEPIITVENILKAKGESVKGKVEAQLKIIDVTKEANGDIKVEVELQHSHELQTQGNNVMGGAQGIIIQGNARIQIGGGGGIGGPMFINGANGNLGLELLDSKGVALKIQQTQQTKMQWQQNGRTIGAIITFRPEKDQEASSLVFKATRLASLDIPFVLKNVAIK